MSPKGPEGDDNNSEGVSKLPQKIQNARTQQAASRRVQLRNRCDAEYRLEVSASATGRRNLLEYTMNHLPPVQSDCGQ